MRLRTITAAWMNTSTSSRVPNFGSSTVSTVIAVAYSAAICAPSMTRRSSDHSSRPLQCAGVRVPMARCRPRNSSQTAAKAA